MQTWIDAVRAELGLREDVDLTLLLEVARVAAHAVERPAAPVTTFLMGCAVAHGAEVENVAARIARLAAEWSDSPIV